MHRDILIGPVWMWSILLGVGTHGFHVIKKASKGMIFSMPTSKAHILCWNNHGQHNHQETANLVIKLNQMWKS